MVCGGVVVCGVWCCGGGCSHFFLRVVVGCQGVQFNGPNANLSTVAKEKIKGAIEVVVVARKKKLDDLARKLGVGGAPSKKQQSRPSPFGVVVPAAAVGLPTVTATAVPAVSVVPVVEPSVMLGGGGDGGGGMVGIEEDEEEEDLDMLEF